MRERTPFTIKDIAKGYAEDARKVGRFTISAPVRQREELLDELGKLGAPPQQPQPEEDRRYLGPTPEQRPLAPSGLRQDVAMRAAPPGRPGVSMRAVPEVSMRAAEPEHIRKEWKVRTIPEMRAITPEQIKAAPKYEFTEKEGIFKDSLDSFYVAARQLATNTQNWPDVMRITVSGDEYQIARLADRIERRDRLDREWLLHHPEAQPDPRYLRPEENPEIKTEPAYWAYIMAQMVPYSLMAFVGAATGSLVAGPPGAVVGATAVLTPVTTADLYRELIQSGATPKQAANVSAALGPVSAGLESMTEAIGLSKLAPGIGRALTQGFTRKLGYHVFRQALAQGGKAFTAMEVGEILTEQSQNVLTNLARMGFDESVSAFDGWQEVLFQVTVGALPMAGFGSAVASITTPGAMGSLAETAERIAREETGAMAMGGEAVKRPWQMTRAEWASQTLARTQAEIARLSLMKPREGSANWAALQNAEEAARGLESSVKGGTQAVPLDWWNAHKNAIQAALSEGKPVPAEVLAEYPDLQKQAAVPRGESIDQALSDFEVSQQAARANLRYGVDITKATESEYVKAGLASYRDTLKGTGFPIDVKKQTQILKDEYRSLTQEAAVTAPAVPAEPGEPEVGLQPSVETPAVPAAEAPAIQVETPAQPAPAPEVPKPVPAPALETPVEPVQTMTEMVGAEGLIQRRATIQGMLSTPAKQLPKGTTKIALRQELKAIQKQLGPAESKLRQQIMTAVRQRGLTQTQARDIFKKSGGNPYLTQMEYTALGKVLKAVQKARPTRVKNAIVITPKTEVKIQTTKSALGMSDKDYAALMRMLKYSTDRYESGQKFITEAQGRKMIQAMRRQTQLGFASIEQAILALAGSMGPPPKVPPIRSAESFEETRYRKTVENAKGIAGRTYRMERMLREMDGYVEPRAKGLWWSTFYGSLHKAYLRQLSGILRRYDAWATYVSVFDVDMKAVMGAREPSVVKGLNLSPSEKIGIALLSKNPDGLRHLTKGYGWSETQVARIVDSLTEDEQKVATFLRQDLDAEFAALKDARMLGEGKDLGKVSNYFPIRLKWIADPEIDYWAQLAREDNRQFMNEWASASLPKGFTKGRVPEANQPIDYDAINIWYRHVEATEMYKAFVGITKDLQAIAKHPEFRTRLKARKGREFPKILDSWLKDAVTDRSPAPNNHIEAMMRVLRINSTNAVLALNVVVAMKQFASWVAGAGSIGETAALKGLFAHISDRKGTRALLKEYAPDIFMRHLSFEREVAEIARTISPQKALRGKRTQRETLMFLTLAIDEFTVDAIWRGGFDDYLTKHPGEFQAAADHASEAIRDTQPFFHPKDLPEYWRSNSEIAKGLTRFTNQLNQYWNLARFDVFGKAAAGKLKPWDVVRKILEYFILPALIFGAMNRSRLQETPEEVGKDIASTAIGMIPIIGPFARAGMSGWRDAQGMITLQPLETFQEAVYYANKGEWDKVGLTALEMGAYVRGIPYLQARRTVEGIVDLASGTTDDWMRLMYSEYTREESLSPVDKVRRDVDKAVESIATKTEEGEVYTTAKLRSDLWKALQKFAGVEEISKSGEKTIRIDRDTVDELKLGGLVDNFLTYEEYADDYYALPQELRDSYEELNPQMVSYFYFWGQWSGAMDDETETRVRAWATKYDIPLLSIPVFRKQVTGGTTISPSARTPSTLPRDQALESLGAMGR